MNKCSGIFGQILKVFSRSEFYRAVKEQKAERGAKGFSCWDQIVAMLFCQLGQEMLRYNLLTYPDLWVWIDNPYETPLIVPDVEQLSLGVG